MKTSLLTMVALILILVLASFTVVYALLRLWLGLPILPELTFQGENSSEAIASPLPSEDVPGANIPGLPRYPDSVRVEYEREEVDDLLETRVGYGAAASGLDSVREFYRDTFREEGWSVENAEFSEGTWTFLVTQDEREALVEFETLTGATFAYLIDNSHRRLPLSDIVRLGLHLCSAIHYLHRHGILHLDLKPSNRVSERQLAKVLDLSVARPPGRESRASERRIICPPSRPAATLSAQLPTCGA